MPNPNYSEPTSSEHHGQDHSHLKPVPSGLSIDPVTIVAAAFMSALVLAGVIICFSFALHTGTTSPDHHYQCVDSIGKPADSSECSRGGDIPSISAPVIVP